MIVIGGEGLIMIAGVVERDGSGGHGVGRVMIVMCRECDGWKGW